MQISKEMDKEKKNNELEKLEERYNSLKKTIENFLVKNESRDFDEIIKKNERFKILSKELTLMESKIKNLILFPTNGKKIQEEIFKNNGKKRLFQYFFVDNMKDAVKLAYQHTKEGKSCLLSCASASFGIFRNYKERGNLFKKYVKKFAYEKNV